MNPSCNNCGRIEVTSGINRFWIAKNSTQLSNTLLGNKKTVWRYYNMGFHNFLYHYTSCRFKEMDPMSFIESIQEKPRKKVIITPKKAFVCTAVENGQYGLDEV